MTDDPGCLQIGVCCCVIAGDRRRVVEAILVEGGRVRGVVGVRGPACGQFPEVHRESHTAVSIRDDLRRPANTERLQGEPVAACLGRGVEAALFELERLACKQRAVSRDRHRENTRVSLIRSGARREDRLRLNGVRRRRDAARDLGGDKSSGNGPARPEQA
jgi:hypothetical protein